MSIKNKTMPRIDPCVTPKFVQEYFCDSMLCTQFLRLEKSECNFDAFFKISKPVNHMTVLRSQKTSEARLLTQTGNNPSIKGINGSIGG